MENLKRIKPLLSLAGLIISVFVIMYYWQAATLQEIKYVPLYIMILLISYILVQLIKRHLTKEQNWYDWLYYIGLASIALPVFFASVENVATMLTTVQIGACFLAIPILIEGYFMTKPKK